MIFFVLYIIDGIKQTNMFVSILHNFFTVFYSIHKKKVVSYNGDRTAEDISRFAVRCRRYDLLVLFCFLSAIFVDTSLYLR